MQSLTTLLISLEEYLPYDLLDLTLKATVILLIAALAVRALRRSSSAIRHGVWTAALLSIVALPLFSRGLPRFEVPAIAGFLPIATQDTSDEQRATPEPLLEPAAGKAFIPGPVQDNVDARLVSRSSPDIAVEPRTLNVHRRIATFGLATWLFGALSVLLTTAMRAIRTFYLRSSSTEVKDSEWNGSMSEAIQQHRLFRRLRFLENPTVSVPMTCGTIRPAILIPPGFSCSAAERRRILQHEFAHVIRFDVALQTLGRVACALYWFHPLAWWCLRQMHREREHRQMPHACVGVVHHQNITGFQLTTPFFNDRRHDFHEDGELKRCGITRTDQPALAITDRGRKVANFNHG